MHRNFFCPAYINLFVPIYLESTVYIYSIRSQNCGRLFPYRLDDLKSSIQSDIVFEDPLDLYTCFKQFIRDNQHGRVHEASCHHYWFGLHGPTPGPRPQEGVYFGFHSLLSQSR